MEKLKQLLNKLIPKETKNFLPLIYGEKIKKIEDFIYPNELTKLRPGKGLKGLKMIPQYVVIHDTGMTNPEDNALGLSKYIHAQASSPTGRVASWHFSIDDSICFQHIPTDEAAWHAGDGSHEFGSNYYNEHYQKECIGGGNTSGIAIESCINPSNDYPRTVLRMARLTAELLVKYNLEMDRIKQHYDFSGKNCPNVIRASDGLWEMFLTSVELEKELIRIDPRAKLSWEISHPEIVKRNGTIKTPLKDTTVEISLYLRVLDKDYKYFYTTLVLGLSEEERISKAYDLLISSVIEQRISQDIKMPKYLKEMDVEISWKSSNEEILSAEGKYTMPLQKEIITLEASIKTQTKLKKYQIEVEVI